MTALVLPEKLAFLAPHLDHTWEIGAAVGTNADWAALGSPVVCRPCGVGLYRGARGKPGRHPERLASFFAELASRDVALDRDGLPRFSPKVATPPTIRTARPRP